MDSRAAFLHFGNMIGNGVSRQPVSAGRVGGLGAALGAGAGGAGAKAGRLLEPMPVFPLPFREVRLVEPSFTYLTPGVWQWQPGAREHWNLWIAQRGVARVTIDGHLCAVQPWTALVIPPTAAVRGWQEPGTEGGLQNFSAHWVPVGGEPGRGSAGAEGAVGAVGEVGVAVGPGGSLVGQEPPAWAQWAGLVGPELPVVALQIQEVDTAQALIQGLLRLSVYRDALAQQQADGLLLALLGLVWRERQVPWESPADAVILRQMERVRSGRDLFTDVETLAAEAGLSRVHYGRRFKRLAGCSPSAFLIGQRVERATKLLQETHWKLERVADAVGYADLYFFSRQFKSVTGLSPGAFRRNHR